MADDPRDGYRRIRLFPGERLDRDFILRFRLGDTNIRSTLTLHPDSSGEPAGTFALTVVPPLESAEQPARRRAVAFVLDRSGSMEGWKIVAARRAVARMIDTLRDCDRFCVIAFDNRIQAPPGLPGGLASATDQNRFRAVEYLAGVGARGGTLMAGPLERAVNVLSERPAEEEDRVLVLITDGQVGNEDQILSTLGKRLKSIRVFTLGIDRAVNEGFLRRLAERGGGACELVESESRLDEVMQSIHRRIGTPLLTGLYLESEGISIEPGEVVPRRLPDLFSGSPLLILGRSSGRSEASLLIHATDARGRAWSETLPANPRDNPAIASAWARGQIRQVEDRYAAGDGDRATLERTIVALSLKFQVLSRFTAYVAVDHSQTVNRGGALHQIVQPVETPSGWSDSLVLNFSLDRDLAMTRLPDVCLRAMAEARSDLNHPAPSSAIEDSRLPGEFEETNDTCLSAGQTLETWHLGRPGHASPPPGPLPDRLQIGEIFAHGSMGQIYKAYDRVEGKPVLVKVIPGRVVPADVIARWRRANKLLRRLEHPAFGAALDMGRSGKSFWMILPFYAGETLRERLRSAGRIPFREAATLVAELAEALQIAHEQGLVNGDLTPDHVFLGEDGQMRVFNFGGLPLQPAGSEPHLTTGRPMGTPSYMAPEQARGEPAFSRTQCEVYALGVILYEIMTGAVPFAGTSVIELLKQVLNDEPQRPRRRVRSIPAALESICLKAMAKDCSNRYATAGELAAALRAFLAPARRKGFWKSK